MGINTLWIFLGICVSILVIYKLSFYYASGGKHQVNGTIKGGRRQKRKKRKLTSK